MVDMVDIDYYNNSEESSVDLFYQVIFFYPDRYGKLWF